MKHRNLGKASLVMGCCLLATGSALYADSIDVTLTDANQTVVQGTNLVTFDATIANLSSTDTVFLNGDSSTTSSTLLTVDDTPYLTNFPLSLDPSEVSGPFALFNVMIDPSTPTGTYDFNSFSILGGLDGAASDTIGTADFSVTVVSSVPAPELGSLALLFAGLLGIVVLMRFTTFAKAN